MNELISLIVIPFIVGLASSAIVVLVGVRSLKDYIKERALEEELGRLAEFWSSPAGSRSFNVIFAAEWQGRIGEIEPRFGYAQAYGVSELMDCFDKAFSPKAVVRLIVVKKNDPLPLALFDENVVVIGGELSLAAFRDLSVGIGVPYYQYDLDPAFRSMQTAPQVSPQEIITSNVSEGKLLADIGTVTRIVNPANRKLVVTFNGNYGAGLLGAILAVTRNGPLIQGWHATSAAQQLLVKVPNISSNVIDQNHTVEAVRDWVNFQLPNDGLARALQSDGPLSPSQS